MLGITNYALQQQSLVLVQCTYINVVLPVYSTYYTYKYVTRYAGTHICNTPFHVCISMIEYDKSEPKSKNTYLNIHVWITCTPHTSKNSLQK